MSLLRVSASPRDPAPRRTHAGREQARFLFACWDRIIFAAFLLAIPLPGLAQAVVTSPGPDSTSVTLYRDPDRGDGAIDPGWLNGFALITERRRIALPAGEATIRFEGVADGMIAVSAVVTDLPGGVVEKNRDSALLSPAALLDGALGNRVHLRRTDPATGKVTQEDAVIRSGPDNAVVLQTAKGFEGLRCSGLPETIVYDSIPSGLSAKPTLSVTTRSPGPAEADVTLTYLATGFDWSAHYVAHVNPGGKTLDLFGWLTVANGNSVTFADSQLLAIAGRVNREGGGDAREAEAPSPVLNLRCWPLGTTSMAAIRAFESFAAAPMVAPPLPVAAMAKAMDEVTVTAAHRAVQEDLGDLKLYRVPMRVDVNAQGQKQVALLEKRSVPFERLYGATLVPDAVMEEAAPLRLILRMRNRAADGLGLPLPSGRLTLFEPRGGAQLLLGEDDLADHAVGEAVEAKMGESPQLFYRLERLGADTGRRARYRLTLANANDRAAPAEIRLQRRDGMRIVPAGAKLVRKDGDWLWKAMVPANGSARLDYALTEEN